MIVSTVIGNLGAAPEFKALQDGTPVLELRVASNEYKGDPTWVRVSMFGKRAESLAKLNLEKGTKVAASGTMKLREFARKDGSKGSSLELRANEIELLGGKRDGAGATTTNGGGGYDEDPPF